jgi:hypothetical protein
MHENTLTLFYTGDILIVVLHVMVPQPFGFLLCMYGNLTILEFSSKSVKVMLTCKVGEGCL